MPDSLFSSSCFFSVSFSDFDKSIWDGGLRLELFWHLLGILLAKDNGMTAHAGELDLDGNSCQTRGIQVG